MASDIPIIPPSSNPITASDMGAVPSDFWERLQGLEDQGDEALRRAMGSKYRHDPFQLAMGGKLRAEELEKVISPLNELSGLNRLLEKGLGPTMFRPYLNPDGTLARSPAGRYIFDQELIKPESGVKNTLDPRVLLHSQLTTRFNQAASEVATEKYFSAGTVPRVKLLQKLFEQVDSQLSTDIVDNGTNRAAKMLFFDVESPGLDPQKGIWQLSARTVQGDDVVDKTWHFRNAQMRFGGMAGTETLEQYLSGHKADHELNYEDNMRQFLKMANESDAVAGHNVLFDYNMLHHGLTNTPAYKGDNEFKGLVDTFLNKFYNPDTGDIGNVFDTNKLSRIYLQGIPVANEIANQGTPYSLQNILLQTDLLKRIKQDIGEQRVQEMLGGKLGLHAADVDVPFESHLFKYLQEGAQGGPGLRIYNEGERAPLSDFERSQIASAHALGPNIPFGHTSLLNEEVIRRARAAGYDDEALAQLTPLANMVSSTRNLMLRGTDRSATDMATRAGIWRNMSKEFVTKEGLIGANAPVPTPAEWGALQERLASANMPYAGLSLVERNIAAGLGQAGGWEDGGERDVRKAFGGDIAPLGRFVGASEPSVVGRSQVVRMPVSMLQDWEKETNPGTAFSSEDESQLLHISPFSVKGHSEIGLMARLNEEQRGSLLTYLHGRVEPELLTHIEQSFKNNSGVYGIQLGTLTDLKGGSHVESLRAQIEQIVGEGADISDQTPRIRVGLAGTKGNTVYTGAPLIHADLLNAEEITSYTHETRQVFQHYHHELPKVLEGPLGKTILQAAERGSTSDSEVPLRMMRAYMGARKSAGTVGAAIVGAGAYAYYKHQHNRSRANAESMALQPVRANPMATANVMSNLNDRKVSHANMSSNKYNHLFATAPN